MDSPLLPSFEELSRERKLLQEFCFAHVPSLQFFLAADYKNHPIFRLDDEQPQPIRFRHITSSATCYASIAGCPDEFRPKRRKGEPDFDLLGQRFAQIAISLPLDQWRSDGAAEIYCSCRGLPYVLSRLEQWHPQIEDHLHRIFYQLNNDDQPRFAIGEAAEIPEQPDKTIEHRNWYKPNAYHTYWTLRVMRVLEDRFKHEYNTSKHLPSSRQCSEMLLWARQQLGVQVALHSANSSVLDSDQLAWALAILISQPREYQSNLAEQDFIRHAFKCLFSTQERVGTWRHYAPLFHYPSAGNAYCYVFETFAAILREALQPGAEFVRATLKQHFASLVKLWQYSASTQAKNKNGQLAWSSGHRISSRLESWATASVFEFAQALRRLIGIWTREEALSALNYKPAAPNQAEAKKKILERATVWSCPNLADKLWTMFINPVSMASNRSESTTDQWTLGSASHDDRFDPDLPLIAEKFPRSAILFGPAGTSKTSLVSSIAGAIGWRYIELHPSHFVAEGLPNVQHTADIIFGKLMELDRAVVLFDEIDELVRERDIEPDQFGRFLTTSMLPRLAELWKARKVMYFVATNHIEYFDRAVTRSERFDAIIFISPPSFEAKQRKILDILQTEHHIEAGFASDITEDSINEAMQSISCKSIEKTKGKPLPPKHTLAKFAMLRFDELNELALHLRDGLATQKTITKNILKAALLKINDAKSRSLSEYCRFRSDPLYYERFDASRNAVWVVTAIQGLADGAGIPSPVVEIPNGMKFVKATVGSMTNVEVPGFQVEAANEDGEAGRIKLRKS